MGPALPALQATRPCPPSRRRLLTPRLDLAAVQEAGIDLNESDDDTGPALKKTKTAEEGEEEEGSAVVKPKEKKGSILRKKKRFGGI